MAKYKKMENTREPAKPKNQNNKIRFPEATSSNAPIHRNIRNRANISILSDSIFTSINTGLLNSSNLLINCDRLPKIFNMSLHIRHHS